MPERDRPIDELFFEHLEEYRAYRLRVEPHHKLYESLVPYGIDRLLPHILGAYRQRHPGNGNNVKPSIWDFRLARWAAIASVFFILVQLVVIVLTFRLLLK
jgi:hypothetical protein